MANKYYPLDKLPKREELEKLVPDLHYVKLKVSDLPSEIQNNDLTKKFNSVILAASGSNQGLCVSCIGIRLDKDKKTGKDVIDEHPFLFYFDNSDQNKNFGGIIDHGNWPGRTTNLEQWQINAISASGLTAEFSYKGIPPSGSGTLQSLSANTLLSGITDQFRIFLSKATTKKST